MQQTDTSRRDSGAEASEEDSARGDLAFVLTGGGARAAYQVGVLRWLAHRYPTLRVPILTGVSAGAVNAAHLAGHHGTFGQSVEELVALWADLEAEHVFRVDAGTLANTGIRLALRLVTAGLVSTPEVRGFLDTEPLRRHLTETFAAVNGELTGIEYNLERGALKAIALSTTSYTTGQSVVWIQGRDIEPWTRPRRRSVQTRLTVEHVMASSAIPIFFPAVRLDGAWYGDGGLRLTAPLSPALHLGARKLLAISTRFDKSQAEADRPAVIGYPPAAQVFGVLMNAVFLDLIDQDAARLQRMNQILEGTPEGHWGGMKPIDLLVMRPSQDLAVLAGEYEPRLPPALRFLVRATGSRETASPDMLSMLMFQPDYLRRLIDMGEADAERRADEFDALVSS